MSSQNVNCQSLLALMSFQIHMAFFFQRKDHFSIYLLTLMLFFTIKVIFFFLSFFPNCNYIFIYIYLHCYLICIFTLLNCVLKQRQRVHLNSAVSRRNVFLMRCRCPSLYNVLSKFKIKSTFFL